MTAHETFCIFLLLGYVVHILNEGHDLLTLRRAGLWQLEITWRITG